MLFSTEKEMSYQVMERHGVNLNAYYQGKEVSLKRLYIVGFQCCCILEKVKPRRQ